MGLSESLRPDARAGAAATFSPQRGDRADIAIGAPFLTFHSNAAPKLGQCPFVNDAVMLAAKSHAGLRRSRIGQKLRWPSDPHGGHRVSDEA
jgi:hypothetical protein